MVNNSTNKNRKMVCCIKNSEKRKAQDIIEKIVIINAYFIAVIIGIIMQNYMAFTEEIIGYLVMTSAVIMFTTLFFSTYFEILNKKKLKKESKKSTEGGKKI